MRKSIGDRIFIIGNYTFFIVMSIAMLYPFWYTLVASLVPYSYFATHPILLWPREFTLEGYRLVFRTRSIIDAYGVTLFATIAGTTLSMLMTCLAAYLLAHKRFPIRRFLIIMILITMMFNGGLIPTYLTLNRYGLINNLWVYVVPYLINSFYLIILKRCFQDIPQEINDAAMIDGCNDFAILFRVYLPLALPTLATLLLFYAVDRWGDLFTSMFYIVDAEKFSLQACLYKMIKNASNASNIMQNIVRSDQVRFAAIMASTIPILIVYPFIQKYFIRGMMVGAVKG